MTSNTAERTLEGVESMHMTRKGQVKRLDGRRLGGAGGIRREPLRGRRIGGDTPEAFVRLNSMFATQPIFRLPHLAYKLTILRLDLIRRGRARND